MRVVLQRVSKAAVRIDGRVVGSIGTGFCLLVGFTHSDTAAQAEWLAEHGCPSGQGFLFGRPVEA